MHELLTVLALAFLAFGAISGWAEHSSITAPMLFVALGIGLGEWGLGWLALSPESAFIRGLGELALMLVLFTDAARIDLPALRRQAGIPVRLLTIGLPLSCLAGAGLAWLCLDGFGIWDALLLAAILAPTDAALGQAVVASPLVPQRIRQSLNVESGLNDGIALPVVLLAVSFAVAEQGGGDASSWFRFAALQIGLAPLVGVIVGYTGGQLLSNGAEAERITPPFQRLSALGLAVLAFAGAELVGGNGFIAAFVCGLTLGNRARSVCKRIYDFGEAEGQLLTLLVFFVFGAVLLPAFAASTPVFWVYAIASLTLVRMLPVAIALFGTGLRPVSVAFLGWFGPRGLASILYLLIVVEADLLKSEDAIRSIVVLTVALSTLLHGITAYPLAAYYGAAVNAFHEEQRQVPEHPVRLPFRKPAPS